jgi:hypothetical protein
MHDRFNRLARDDRGECAGRGDIGFDELKISVRERGPEIFPTAGPEIIHAGDGVSGGQESVHRVTADEAGGAGDEEVSHEARTFRQKVLAKIGVAANFGKRLEILPLCSK